MSIPVLYESNATDFFNNGLGTLPDALSATVTEERNGEFVLDMTYPLHGIRANQIKNNRIIKVDAGHKLTDQRFVIKTVTPTMDNSGNTVITVHAEHVSYLANDLAIKPQVAMTDVNAEQALNMWNSSLTTPNQFTVDSDITTHNSTSWSIDKVENARQALGGVEGSILDVWGGEYRFDNLHISLMSKRGTVSNTLLAYGRNITSFEQEQNIMDTYTSVYPYYVLSGEANEDSTIYTVPNLVVNSDNANKFPNQKTMPLEVSSYLGDIKVGTKPADTSADDKTEYITVQELQSRMTKIAQQYIKNNNIGVPKVSIKVSFVDLSKTANYADVAPLEQLDLCDEVPVRFPELDIDTTAKVSRVIWNVLLDSYDSLELGDISATLGDKLSQVEQIASNANDKADKAKNIAQTGADGKSTVFRGTDTPTANHIGDLWYKPNGEDTEMYQWDGVSWHFVMSTKDTHEISDKVDQAMQEMADKEKEINGKLELNQIDISQAQKDLEQVKQDTANQLADIRDSVVKDVADAKAQSKDALDKANVVDDKATEALTNAEQAVNDAKEAQSTTATIKTDVDTVKGQLSSKADKTTVDDLTKTVSNNSTSITQNAKDIKTKANSSTVNTLAGKVTDAETSISQNATDIKSKADKSTVDTLNQTVKNQSTKITQNADAIKSKASSSDVDKLSGRVSTAETTLTQTAQGLTGKADTTQLNKLSGDLTTLSNNFSTTSAGFNASLSKIDDKVNANKEETDSALSVAKADIKATADNLSTNYTKTTDEHNYVNSQIKQSADKINLSVASVSDKVDGMEIGGRNYFLNSSSFKITPRGEDYYDWIDLKVSPAFLKNNNRLKTNNIKISFTIYALKALPANFNGRMYFRNSPWYSQPFSYPKGTTDKKRIELTYSITDPNYSVSEMFIRFMAKDTAEYPFMMENAQLEVGNKATDWSPAPEDTDSKIAALQIDADGIKQTVSNKADTSYVDQKAGEISHTVTEVSNKVDGLSYDNRNLLLDSTFTKVPGKWAYDYKGITPSHDGNNNLVLTIPTGATIENRIYQALDDISWNDIVTFSFYAYVDNNSKVDTIKVGTGGYDNLNYVSVSKGNLKRYSSSFKWGSSSSTFTLSVGNYQSPTTGTILHITKVKLEKGNKATDWSPAPEDLATVTALSKVDQKADSISTTVTNNKKDVDSKFTNVNQTISGIQSTVKNKADASQITQLSNQINLKVSQTDFNNMQVGGRNYVTNGNFADGTNGWTKFGNIDTYQIWDDGRLVYSSTKAINGYTGAGQNNIPISGSKGDNTTVSFDACYFGNNPSNYAKYINIIVHYNDNSGTIVSQSKNSIDMTGSVQRYSFTIKAPTDFSTVNVRFVYDSNTLYRNKLGRVKIEKGTKATDYSDSPDDKADKANLVSQINIDKSGVLIQGKKIMIDGDATIKNAVIKSSMIDTLDASKITAGTLDAANVDIINLNANNITTGTLRGTNLSMNLNTGEVLFQKGSIKSTNGKLNISVDDGTMSVTNSSNEGIYFKDGKMMLSNSDPYNNQNIAYGLVNYEVPWILNGGLTITGYQGALLTATNKNITASSFNDNHPWFRDTFGNINFYGGFTDGSGVAVRENDIVIGSAIGRVDLSGGTAFTLPIGGLYEQPHIEVGTPAWNDGGVFNDSKKVGKNIILRANGIDLAAATTIAAHVQQFNVYGNFTVHGKKNAVVSTSKGDVAIDAYETAEYYFGDIGSLNTGKSGCAKVIIDSLFNETVNTSIPYHVFITAYEEGYIWVTDRTPTSFIVHSSKPNIDVSYEIKAKRLGYEGDRLEIQKEDI